MKFKLVETITARESGYVLVLEGDKVLLDAELTGKKFAFGDYNDSETWQKAAIGSKSQMYKLMSWAKEVHEGDYTLLEVESKDAQATYNKGIKILSDFIEAYNNFYTLLENKKIISTYNKITLNHLLSDQVDQVVKIFISGNSADIKNMLDRLANACEKVVADNVIEANVLKTVWEPLWKIVANNYRDIPEYLTTIRKQKNIQEEFLIDSFDLSGLKNKNLIEEIEMKFKLVKATESKIDESLSTDTKAFLLNRRVLLQRHKYMLFVQDACSKLNDSDILEVFNCLEEAGIDIYYTEVLEYIKEHRPEIFTKLGLDKIIDSKSINEDFLGEGQFSQRLTKSLKNKINSIIDYYSEVVNELTTKLEAIKGFKSCSTLDFDGVRWSLELNKTTTTISYDFSPSVDKKQVMRTTQNIINGTDIEIESFKEVFYPNYFKPRLIGDWVMHLTLELPLVDIDLQESVENIDESLTDFKTKLCEILTNSGFELSEYFASKMINSDQTLVFHPSINLKAYKLYVKDASGEKIDEVEVRGGYNLSTLATILNIYENNFIKYGSFQPPRNESINEAIDSSKKETIELIFKKLDFSQRGSRNYSDGSYNETEYEEDWIYEVDKDELYDFIFQECLTAEDYPPFEDPDYDASTDEEWANYSNWLDANFDVIFNKYENDILNHYEEEAREDAEENYNSYDYIDWDSRPGGYDYIMDRRFNESKELNEANNWREIKNNTDFTSIEACLNEIEVSCNKILKSGHECIFTGYKYKKSFIRADIRLACVMVGHDGVNNVCKYLSDSEEWIVNDFENKYINPCIDMAKRISDKYGFDVKFYPWYNMDRAYQFIDYYLQIRCPIDKVKKINESPEGDNMKFKVMNEDVDKISAYQMKIDNASSWEELQEISNEIKKDSMLTADEEYNLRFDVAEKNKQFNESKEEKICCICKKPFDGYGNNAEPVCSGTCCDECNIERVIPMRFKMMKDNNKGYREDPEVFDFDINDRVAERWNDGEFNVGTVIDIKEEDGKQYLVKWDYSDGPSEEWLYGDILTKWVEEIDESLNESPDYDDEDDIDDYVNHFHNEAWDNFESTYHVYSIDEDGEEIDHLESFDNEEDAREYIAGKEGLYHIVKEWEDDYTNETETEVIWSSLDNFDDDYSYDESYKFNEEASIKNYDDSFDCDAIEEALNESIEVKRMNALHGLN